MLFISNVLTGLTIGTGGRVDRVMAVRILDARLTEKAFYGCESASVEHSSAFVAVQHECGRTMAWLASLTCVGRDSRLIQSGVCRRCADWMRGGLRRFSPVFQMVQNLFDDDWVFDAGNHLDRAATLLTGFDIDLEYPSRKQTLKHLNLERLDRVESASSSRFCERLQ